MRSRATIRLVKVRGPMRRAGRTGGSRDFSKDYLDQRRGAPDRAPDMIPMAGIPMVRAIAAADIARSVCGCAMVITGL